MDIFWNYTIIIIEQYYSQLVGGAMDSRLVRLSPDQVHVDQDQALATDIVLLS